MPKKKNMAFVAAALAIFCLITGPVMASENISELLEKIKSSEIEGKRDSKSLAAIKKIIADSDSASRTVLSESLDETMNAEYRCALIDVLGSSKSEEVSKKMAEYMGSKDHKVRACAAISLGEQKNRFAAEALFKNFESYAKTPVSRGRYEEMLKNRIEAINSVWAIGEIGDIDVMKKMMRYYEDSDEIIRMNIVIAAGKIKMHVTRKFLVEITKSSKESDVVRSLAWEMIDELDSSK